jgi:hypothetical protein
MKALSSNNSARIPLDVDTDMQVIANDCKIRVRTKGNRIVISGQVLRAIFHSKRILPEKKVLTRIIRAVDKAMRCADISLCCYSRRLVVLGSKSAPIVLTAILAVFRFWGRKPV